jgi:hypothetical protein
VTCRLLTPSGSPIKGGKGCRPRWKEALSALKIAPSRQKRAFRFPKFWNFTVGRFLFFPESKNGRWGRCARNARTLSETWGLQF